MESHYSVVGPVKIAEAVHLRSIRIIQMKKSKKCILCRMKDEAVLPHLFLSLIRKKERKGTATAQSICQSNLGMELFGEFLCDT